MWTQTRFSTWRGITICFTFPHMRNRLESERLRIQPQICFIFCWFYCAVLLSPRQSCNNILLLQIMPKWVIIGKVLNFKSDIVCEGVEICLTFHLCSLRCTSQIIILLVAAGVGLRDRVCWNSHKSITTLSLSIMTVEKVTILKSLPCIYPNKRDILCVLSVWILMNSRMNWTIIYRKES